MMVKNVSFSKLKWEYKKELAKKLKGFHFGYGFVGFKMVGI